MKKTKVFAIVGPTSSGKTQVSLELSSLIDAEIISADSMQVYYGMDIGTAKLPLEKRLSPAHHMVDVCFPSENFSVALYRKMARSCIFSCQKRNNLPLVVGGSALYITALLSDIVIPDGNKDSALRRELEKRALNDPDGLVSELKKIDEASLNIINPKNLRRIVRALEIYQTMGWKYSELNEKWKNRQLYYDAKIICIYIKRNKLYELIEKRVDMMIKTGLIDEALFIREKWPLSTSAYQALGYKEIYDYLDGKISKEQAIEEIKKRTRHYAKRQLTWFRNDPHIEMLDYTDLKIKDLTKLILNRYSSYLYN